MRQQRRENYSLMNLLIYLSLTRMIYIPGGSALILTSAFTALLLLLNTSLPITLCKVMCSIFSGAVMLIVVFAGLGNTCSRAAVAVDRTDDGLQ